jgi:hypothetical protein
MHPGSEQPRLFREPLIDHRLQGIQLRRHPLAAVDGLRALLEIPLHRPLTADQSADLGVRVALMR